MGRLLVELLLTSRTFDAADTAAAVPTQRSGLGCLSGAAIWGSFYRVPASRMLKITIIT